jgi:hypothetical protein
MFWQLWWIQWRWLTCWWQRKLINNWHEYWPLINNWHEYWPITDNCKKHELTMHTACYLFIYVFYVHCAPIHHHHQKITSVIMVIYILGLFYCLFRNHAQQLRSWAGEWKKMVEAPEINCYTHLLLS